MASTDVLIVGGGLAGLACAVELAKAGVSFHLMEASDRVGGRVRTDALDGFLLDRGFQVLLTAYPETVRTLDYGALGLGAFRSGAIVRAGGKFHKVADPMRSPADALKTVFAGVGSLVDKLKIAELRWRTSSGSLEDLFRRPETTTLAALQSAGFSAQMIECFFRPFFGGIFLEPDMVTSSRKFEFVFRMFSEGESALPAHGMEMIPAQLALRLPLGSIRTGVRLASVEAGRVETEDGEQMTARNIVIATEEPEAARLLGRVAPAGQGSVVCLYFDAPQSPVDGPWLVLNGETHGPVNNLCVPSEVCPEYAPPGRALVSVSVLGNPSMMDKQIEHHVRAQLTLWYGASVAEWRHLRTYRIPYAVPLQAPGSLQPVAKTVRIRPGVYACGDYADVSSLHGAMVSGRRAAQEILEA